MLPRSPHSPAELCDAGDAVPCGHVTVLADHAELLKRMIDFFYREGGYNDGA